MLSNDKNCIVGKQNFETTHMLDKPYHKRSTGTPIQFCWGYFAAFPCIVNPAKSLWNGKESGENVVYFRVKYPLAPKENILIASKVCVYSSFVFQPERRNLNKNKNIPASKQPTIQ